MSAERESAYRVVFSGPGEGGTDSDILEVQSNDGTITNLTGSMVGAEFAPRYSPSGSKLAYGTFDGSDFDIVIVNVGSFAPDIVIDSTIDDFNPAWHPSGRALAIERASSPTNHNIYVWDMSSDDLTTIGATGFDERDPIFSQDGYYVAFASQVGSGSSPYHLKARASTGVGPSISMLPGLEGDFRWPSFTADGSKMVFCWKPVGGDFDIYWVDAATALAGGAVTPVKLFDSDGNEQHPEISPDGRWLVYSRRDTGTTSNIYIRRVDGTGEETALTSSGYNTRPAFGPRI